MNKGEVFLAKKSTHFMNVWGRYFSKVMNQFLHNVAAITFFCLFAKNSVSGQSTFYIALKLPHFMLTHVLVLF